MFSVTFCTSMFVFATSTYLPPKSENFVGSLLIAHKAVSDFLQITSCLFGVLSGMIIVFVLLGIVLSILKVDLTDKRAIYNRDGFYAKVCSSLCLLFGCMLFLAFKKGVIT